MPDFEDRARPISSSLFLRELTNSSSSGQQPGHGTLRPTPPMEAQTSAPMATVSLSPTSISSPCRRLGEADVPTQAATTSVAGACAPTVFGSTISAPGQVTVQNPGSTTNLPPQATIGIGTTGLLVEDNGLSSATRIIPITANSEVLLGARYGRSRFSETVERARHEWALGSAVPWLRLRSRSLLRKLFRAANSRGGPLISRPLVSPACHRAAPLFAAQTGALVNGIYGGDYPQTNGQDDPSASPDGFGNCDLAIDLGSQ